MLPKKNKKNSLLNDILQPLTIDSVGASKSHAYNFKTDKIEPTKLTPEVVLKVTNSPKTSVINASTLVVTSRTLLLTSDSSGSDLLVSEIPVRSKRPLTSTPAAEAISSTSVTTLPSKPTTSLTISPSVLSKPLTALVTLSVVLVSEAASLFSIGEATEREARPKAKIVENFIVRVKSVKRVG